ncbi:MAG TPA: DUF3800 domain-containing protein [Galbitalea sp.]
MLFAFIDESYTQDRYYVCAFVVHEDQLTPLAAAVKSAGVYAEGFGVVPGSELHAHDMMAGDGGWKAIRRVPSAAIAIYKRALQELVGIPTAKMFISGVDVVRLNARYSYPEPPHRVTLKYLLEAVDRYAVKVNEEVMVIADELPDQADHSRRAENYQIVGTGGYRSSKLATIQMPITFGSSADSPGLQAADLVVYLYRRYDAHTETDRRTAKAVAQMWEMLRPIWGHVRRWDP